MHIGFGAFILQYFYNIRVRWKVGAANAEINNFLALLIKFVNLLNFCEK